MKKKDLLKDASRYTDTDIVEAIKGGIVTLYELSSQSEVGFSPVRKKRIKALLNQPVDCEERKTTPIGPTQSSLPKKTILKDVSRCSDEQLSTAVRNGVVSLYELCKAGLSPVRKHRIEELLNSPIELGVSETVTSVSDVDAENESYPSQREGAEKIVEESNGELEAIDDPVIGDNVPSSDYGVEEPVYENNTRPRSIFSWRGRIRRLEYGITFIVLCIVNAALRLMEGSEEPVALMLVLLSYLLSCYIGIVQSIKRSHDIGHSGWWILIPFYGLWLLFKCGDSGSNEYGADPKQ